MKLVMESKNLLEGLNIVTRALASKPVQPILDGVYLVTENNRVTLTCSDGSFTIRWHGECSTEEDGAAILPGKLFAELVRKLPNGTVSIEADERIANIRCQKSKSKLSVIVGNEYPNVAAVEGVDVNVSQAVLRDMIGHVSFAIATDESRLILTGGLVEIEPNEIRMVALDGFRLAMQKAAGEFGVTENTRVVIPGRVLNEMGKAMGDTEEECIMTIGSSRMACRFGEIEMAFSLLAGEYIDYTRIIPKSFTTEVNADIGALSDAIDRASLMAREGKNNLINLNFTEDSVKITSNAETGSVEEELEVSTHGNNINIAFNSKYIVDMLKNISGDSVVLKMNGSTAPCVAMPKDNANCVQLLLPVRTFA